MIGSAAIVVLVDEPALAGTLMLRATASTIVPLCQTISYIAPLTCSMAEEPSRFGGCAEVTEAPDRELFTSAAAASSVVQATTSDARAVWPEALSNVSCAPLGQDFRPVLEDVATFRATLVKPAFFAYEDGRRSFARDLADAGVLAPAGIGAAAVTGSTIAMASAAKIFRLIDKVRSESDRDVGLTGCHRFVARGASAGARQACSGRFGGRLLRASSSVRRANKILKAASAFFARELDPDDCRDNRVSGLTGRPAASSATRAPCHGDHWLSFKSCLTPSSMPRHSTSRSGVVS